MAIILPLYADDPKIVTKTDADQLKVEIVNNNQNNHKIEVRNEQDPYDCSRYTGDALKEKMFYLSKEHFKANLIKFSPRTRRAYRDSLLIEEIKKLLADFDAKEREEINKALGPEGAHFFPVLEKKIADFDPIATMVGNRFLCVMRMLGFVKKRG